MICSFVSVKTNEIANQDIAVYEGVSRIHGRQDIMSIQVNSIWYVVKSLSQQHWKCNMNGIG